MEYIVAELYAIWKVDYYSKDNNMLKQITLGKLPYSEAKREAFLNGLRIPYYVYDIYYI